MLLDAFLQPHLEAEDVESARKTSVDHMEIEIKFHLPEPEKTRQCLIELGAKRIGRRDETNIRLDDQQGSIDLQDRVLRLRRMDMEGSARRHVLTVKLADMGDGSLRSRREIEIEVNELSGMLTALEVLGFNPYFYYEKRREIYVWQDVEIVIDEMPYGWFIEIEGLPEEIRALSKALGFDPNRGLNCGYMKLFKRVAKAMNLKMKNLTFAEFEGIQVDPQLFVCD